MELIKDMVIRMSTDFAGSVKCAWHIRQAIEPKSVMGSS